MRRLISAGLVLGLFAACGGESDSGGSGGGNTGGTSTGGAGASGGAGGAAGGSGGATGGGGGATGGSAGTGGSGGATGGAGGATGGAGGATGGSGGAIGGAGGTGGSSSCANDADCVASAYTKMVSVETDCYCVMCPSVAMTKTEADARAKAWTKVCTAWAKNNPCPVPSCIQPQPVTCSGGQCAFGGSEAGCTTSGGTVSKGLCCSSTADFPNGCQTGPCGCSPSNSHEVKTCQCPSGKCFDGSSCK